MIKYRITANRIRTRITLRWVLVILTKKIYKKEIKTNKMLSKMMIRSFHSEIQDLRTESETKSESMMKFLSQLIHDHSLDSLVLITGTTAQVQLNNMTVINLRHRRTRWLMRSKKHSSNLMNLRAPNKKMSTKARYRRVKRLCAVFASLMNRKRIIHWSHLASVPVPCLTFTSNA